MTSAKALTYFGISAVLFGGSIGHAIDAHAQPAGENEVAASEKAQEENPAVDRGKMRLELLIRLVENELKEAGLLKSRLTVEAAELDQQRRILQAGPSKGTQAEKRQIEVIEKRLGEIDREMADVNERLPEINAEFAELQARLDEANGVVRETDSANAANGVVATPASLWLDSKRRVQEALVYLGGYNALIDGDFGPRTREAIRVYQERQKLDATGTLTEEQEAALLEEAEILRTRYGMTTIEDPTQGYRISYPSGLRPEGGEADRGNRRYVSKDGKGELVISSPADGETTSAQEFSAIYEDLLSRYEVQYRRKRDDWFVVAGLVEEGRIIYDTARLSGGRTIRARLSYPAEWRELWSPFAVIMFNTFEALSPAES